MSTLHQRQTFEVEPGELILRLSHVPYRIILMGHPESTVAVVPNPFSRHWSDVTVSQPAANEVVVSGPDEYDPSVTVPQENLVIVMPPRSKYLEVNYCFVDARGADLGECAITDTIVSHG